MGIQPLMAPAFPRQMGGPHAHHEPGEPPSRYGFCDRFTHFLSRIPNTSQ